MINHTRSYWDLSVNNREGKPILAVEVKRKFNASPEWAAQFRRNILAHGTFPETPYFLMAFPDNFYLWTPAKTSFHDDRPTHTIDAYPILQPYLKRLGKTADEISGQSLEIIVASWLAEIVYFTKSSESLDKVDRWLIDSGLYSALAGGELIREDGS